MKKGMTVLLAVALAFCCAACTTPKEIETTAQTASVAESTQPLTTEAEESSTEAQTEEEPSTQEESTVPDSTVQETTTEYTDNFPFLKQGHWYLYDEKKHCAYAFSFKNGGKAEVAYFNEYNIEGADAKYLVAACDYEMNDNVLRVTGLPSQLNEETFEFIIDGETLLYHNKALEQHDDLSLEHPFQHFNVVGMPYVNDDSELITGVNNG